MSNETDRKCRKAAVLKYYKDGVPIKNIAEEFNIEIDTVRTYIRECKMEEAERFTLFWRKQIHHSRVKSHTD